MSDFDNSDDEKIQRKPVNSNTLDTSIVDILRVYGSLCDCHELTLSEISCTDLRAENIICVRQFKKGKYGLDRNPISLNGIRGFIVPRSSGSGGSNNVVSAPMSGLSDVEKLTIVLANKSAAMAAYNRGEKPLELYHPYVAGFDQDEIPSVLITTPKKTTVITRGLRGIVIEGSSSNAKNIELSWTGSDVGSESKSTAWDKWDGTLPVRAGDYKLTATVSGGYSHSVSFSVILKPTIIAYTAEDIELLNTFQWSEYNKSPEAILVHNLAIKSGLVDKKDDFSETATGSKVTNKVKSFASNVTGDFNIFYSGSGDKAFIDKNVTAIFGGHLSDETKTALIDKLEAKKTAGFIDATSEFHEAMNNTLTIFFAENSIGKSISKLDTALAVNPSMMLVIDAAKTIVNVKLNIELALESNGAPLVMRNQAKKQLFDMVAIEVVGAAVGGVFLKAGSHAFKVIKSYFGKFKHKFGKSQKPQLTADGRVIPYGKTAAESKTIRMPEGAKNGQYHEIDGQKAFYDKDGFIKLDCKFDTVIDKKHIGSGKDREHFKAANENLREALKKDPSLVKKMGLTKAQIKHIEKDPSVQSPPPDMTWHHHQDTGRMQLVYDEPHGSFRHTGGMAIWGGGYRSKRK